MAQPHSFCKGRANTISKCSMMARPSKDDNKTQAALTNTKGRRIEAAQKLGIGRNTITRKIQELGLEKKIPAAAEE